MLKKAVTGFMLMVLVLVAMPLEGKNRTLKWKMATDPYRNYIYPMRTGLQYNITYKYMIESKSLRKFLRRNYDIQASPSIARIFKDVSSGAYFERYLDCRVKYLPKGDTLLVKVIYENGETNIEKFTNQGSGLRFTLHLTRYKQQHDFTTDRVKDGRKRGLISGVDLSVISRKKARGSSHVMILSRILTEADMPGILSKINGREILR